ncbi:hypothetical protein HAX54_011380, partial [Datura stramonium]|nr:hypothetical protein [Datura stramonium]
PSSTWPGTTHKYQHHKECRDTAGSISAPRSATRRRDGALSSVVHRDVLGGQNSNLNSTRNRSCKTQFKSKKER